MVRTKHILRRTAIILSLALLALIALVSFAPRLISSEQVKEQLKQRIAAKIPGTFDLREVEVDLFPRPCVLVRKAALTLQQRVNVRADALYIYPRLLPLFRGEVQIAAARIESPEASIVLPEKKEKPFSLEEAKEKISSIVKGLSQYAPDLDVRVNNGNLRLLEKGRAAFVFTQLRGRLLFSSGHISLAADCSSNLFDAADVRLTLNPSTFNGSGTLKLKNGRPRVLALHLFPGAAYRISDAQTDFRLNFDTMGFQVFRADMQGSAPSVTIVHRKEQSLFRCREFSAALYRDEYKVEAIVKKLKLDYPRMAAAGSLVMNKGDRRAALQIEGKDLDVQGVRAAALRMFGDNAAVAAVFDYVRGGTVPWITIRSSGAVVHDLGASDHLRIAGRLVNGDIYVAKPGLYFRSVSGECSVSNGILSGSHLRARLGSSEAHDGSLKVGFKGKDAPFHLDTLASADMKALQSILRQLVKNDAFIKELDAVQVMGGSARGRLILGESIGHLKTRAELSAFDLSARYRRIPYPVHISGGFFTYDDAGVTARGLSGTVGASSFRGLAGTLRLGDSPYLDIRSTAANIALQELFPWLKSYKALKERLSDISGLSGVAVLSSSRLQGPLPEPGAWQFALRGRVENVRAISPGLPAPLILTAGDFEAQPRHIAFTAVKARMLDASLTASGYLQGHAKADVSFSGTIGSSAFGWMKGPAGVPRWVRDQEGVALRQAHLTFVKNGAVSFTSDFILQKGPHVFLDMVKEPGRITVKKLLIEDNASSAALSLDLSKEVTAFGFSGDLAPATLARLLTMEGYGAGRLHGNFSARLLKHGSLALDAGGTLSADDIVFSPNGKKPVSVDRLSLSAGNGRISVKEALMRYGQSTLLLKGDLRAERDSMLIDMHGAADTLAWDDIRSLIGAKDKKAGTLADVPLRGGLKLTAREFTYGKAVVSPLKASITFSGREVLIAITHADVCGISVPGLFTVSSKGISMALYPLAENRRLDSTVACISALTGIPEQVTGAFTLAGAITAQGNYDRFRDALKGAVYFRATDGRIYHDPHLVRLLAFLEITEVVRGLPDLRKEGFAYRTFSARVELNHGRLEFRDGLLDGPYMKIAAQGVADLADKQLDIRLLASPFRSVDRLLENIPVIRNLLGGTFISIPVRITGDIADPRITYFSLSDADSGLLGIMEKTLRIPFRIIEPLIPGGRKEKTSK